LDLDTGFRRYDEQIETYEFIIRRRVERMNGISESPAPAIQPGWPGWPGWPGYRTLWRWHFYAGLFCLPFVLLLSVTGAIYLFKPQYEAWADYAHDHLVVTGKRARVEAQVTAALATLPGAVLNSYELPATPQAAARVRMGRGTESWLVYVHPETRAILKREVEDERFMNVVSRLHGQLLLGDNGDRIVELAASWAIIMLMTGIYLWWPRNGQGIAGVVYPRFGRGKRVFWRDLHAVTGLWISFFALFLLVSGLPWAKSWGGLLKEARKLGATTEVKQDWSTGRPSATSEHASHDGRVADRDDYSAIDRLVETVQPLRLAPPVQIAPPSPKSPAWTARSDAQNRPLRVTLVLDEKSGAIISRQDFVGRPLLDRIIGTGIAAHEGQLFGWPNQALGAFTALGLVMLVVSSIVLWRRRSPGVLGAPQPEADPVPFSFGIRAIIVTLGLLLPLLGLSLLIVLAAERWVLRRIPSASRYLGLDAPRV
jgi:uncharacterized iron-regulated membrane protein